MGKAGTDTRHRVKQLDDTSIGARALLAGGWSLKMLDTEFLWVHYGAANQADDFEKTMAELFAEGVPVDLRRPLVGPDGAFDVRKPRVPRRQAEGSRIPA